MSVKTKLAVIATLCLGYGIHAANAETVLNVATAGDQNMVDYVKTGWGRSLRLPIPA